MRSGHKHPLQPVLPMFIWEPAQCAQMARLLNADQSAYPTEVRNGWAAAVTELGAYIRELNTAEKCGSAARTQAMNRVNARLDPLRFSLQLVHTREGLKRSLLPAVWDGDTSGRTVPLGLAMIADLAAAGQLAKLRECAYCGKWFAARRNRHDAKFCGKRCQKACYSGTEHGQAKNREYVARSRANRKRLAKVALRQARAEARNRKLGQA
jgi:hypothetical protein